MSNFWEYIQKNSAFIFCPVCNKRFNYFTPKEAWKTLGTKTRKWEAEKRLKQHQKSKQHFPVLPKLPKKPILIKHN